MSLSEAMLSMADHLDEEAKDMEQDGLPRHARVLTKAAGQIRRIVQASAVAQPQTSFGSATVTKADGNRFVEHPHINEALKLEEVKRRQMGKIAQAEEAIAGGMVVCEGGEDDGTSVPIPEGIPDGAKTLIGRQVYVFNLKDRKFVYSEQETRKLQEFR